MQVVKTYSAIRNLQQWQIKNWKRQNNYKLGFASPKNLLCYKGLTTMTNYKLREEKDYKLGFASPKNQLCNKELTTMTN